MTWFAMRKRSAQLVVTSLGVLPGLAFAQISGGEVQVFNELAYDYAECSAYYMVVGVAMENSGDTDLARGYQEIANTALVYAAAFGERAGLLPETTSARVNMALDEMSERIQANTSNIAILNEDFLAPCQAAMEDFAGTLERAFSEATPAPSP